MERTLCVWYPDWPLRRPDAPSDDSGQSLSPHQAVDETNRVIAINAAASEAGVEIGMRRREAEAVCPTVTTHLSDPGAESSRFEPVAHAIESVVPRVEIVMPGLVLVPVTGALSYFGDEQALVERVAKEIDLITGPGYRIGLAIGPFAAQRAAEDATELEPINVVTNDEEFLASLDVAALGKEELAATFRWLGIVTLGELAELPREAVVSRFGPDGLTAHRLASGEDREAYPRAVPVDLTVEERFSPPLVNLEQAAFAARSLGYRLISELSAHGAAPHRVRVEAEAADGEVRVRTWRNNDPFDEATLTERIRWQLRAWLDNARARSGSGIRGGVARLRITPAHVSDRGRQLGLHEDPYSVAEAHRTLVESQAIVGDDGVLMAAPQGGRDPSERVAWYRWGEDRPTPGRDPDAPWPGRIPSPSPALVPADPPLLEVEWDDGMPTRVRLGSRWVPVLSWAGPWRKTGKWWEGEGSADRYQFVTSAGAFLCEVRDGRAFMTGIYD